LREHWLGRLPEGEKKILAVLIDRYPNAVARDELDEATGYKRSSRDAYLRRLSARKLVEAERGEVKASGILF
jgi:DNA-binding MarR family transcriptional regulator